MKLKAFITLDLNRQQRLPENLLIQSVDDALLLFIQQKQCEETTHWSSQDQQLFDFYDRWADILLEARMTSQVLQFGGQSLLKVCFYLDVGDMYQRMPQEQCRMSIRSQILDFAINQHQKVADQWRERQVLTQNEDQQLKAVIEFHQAWVDLLNASSFDLDLEDEQNIIIEYRQDGDLDFHFSAA